MSRAKLKREYYRSLLLGTSIELNNLENAKFEFKRLSIESNTGKKNTINIGNNLEAQ